MQMMFMSKENEAIYTPAYEKYSWAEGAIINKYYHSWTDRRLNGSNG